MSTEREELNEYEYDHAGGTYTAELNERHAKRLKARPVGTAAKEEDERVQGRSTNGATASPTSKSKAKLAVDNKTAGE